MKRLTTITLLVCLTTLAAHAGKSRKIQHYDGLSARNGAIVYALPKAKVYVQITACCTVNLPGPFAQYAERYLASTDAILHRSSIWNFHSAAVCDEMEIDSSHLYTITNETKPLLFAKDKPFLLMVGDWDKKCPEHKEQHPKHSQQPDTLFHTELLGEEVLTSTSIPKMAERAAKQIFQLREARMAILSCDVAHQPDGIATRAILNRIDSVERELTALFTGKRMTIKEKRRFAIDPTKRQTNIIIARLSTIEGIKNADDMIGTPIYVDITPHILTAPTSGKGDKQSTKGYYYNVPGSATVTIRQASGTTNQQTIEIPQNGFATWLDPSIGDIIFTRTGSIKRTK